MNKQEAVNELENAIPNFILNDFQGGKETGLTYALGLVEQLNGSGKPVVPQFVAGQYEKYKSDFEYNLHRLCIDFYERRLHENLYEWFEFDRNKPIETLILMHKFGYKVEKEKPCAVELPDPNSPEHFVLRESGVDKIIADCYLSDNWKLYKNTWLTKLEIKGDFEWAWQPTKEVEE